MLGIFKRLFKGNGQASIDGVDKWFQSDKQFDKLYPPHLQLLAKRHWTPLAVAHTAATFLAEKDGVKILDIGSGVGKFCIAAAYYKPTAEYYGIEQRKNLVVYADAARAELGLQNINFMHGNFTGLNIRDYDHFYFYNPFFENVAIAERIDESLPFSATLYKHYSDHFIKELEQTPPGTRLVTYHNLEKEVPADFALISSGFDDFLKCWIKR